jgi:SAM-dependent methyltransferase
MKQRHFDRFLSESFNLEITKIEGDEILEGLITNKTTSKKHPILKGIPRFVLPDENYAINFGIQWNKFKSTQLDSQSGLTITHHRLWENTKWPAEKLQDKVILEAGSGAGRFTEILLKTGATVVSLDLSNAVDANYDNNYGKHEGDLFIVQANIYDIPFKDGYFDYVFCYGVIQHTPDPDLTYFKIFQKVKPGGSISIDSYRDYGRPRFAIHYKYSWRKITTKIKPHTLLRIIKFYMPFWLPIDIALKKLPFKIGSQLLYVFPIPCWNYYGRFDLKYKALLNWAVMDTFDALGATYDQPKTKEQIQKMIESPENAFSEVFYGSNGIVANARKRI